MVRLTLAATLLLLQQGATNAFTVPAAKTATGSALFSFSAFQYEEPDAIMMEQNGIVPAKARKPIKTQPSAVSKIKIEKVSDDQHDFNYHGVHTVASSMSKIDRGPSSDDQHDSNYHTVPTVPSAMSKIDRGPTSDDQHDANFKKIKTLPSSFSKIQRASTKNNTPKYSKIPSINYNKKSTMFASGQQDPYYE